MRVSKLKRKRERQRRRYAQRPQQVEKPLALSIGTASPTITHVNTAGLFGAILARPLHSGGVLAEAIENLNRQSPK